MLAGSEIARKSDASVFIGQWVPTLLLFGIYNKLVKQLGSDRNSDEQETF